MIKKYCIIIIKVIIALSVIVLLMGNLVKATDYDDYYDLLSSESVITEDIKDDQFMLRSFETVMDNITETKVVLLSGFYQLASINVKNGVHIEMIPQYGKAKLLIADEKNNIVFYESVSNADLDINPGKYTFYLVGKWYKGRTIITNNP